MSRASKLSCASSDGSVRLLVSVDQPNHPSLRNKMRVDVNIIFITFSLADEGALIKLSIIDSGNGLAKCRRAGGSRPLSRSKKAARESGSCLFEKCCCAINSIIG